MRFYFIFLLLIPLKVFSNSPIWGNELHDFHIHPRNPQLLVFAPNVYGVFEYNLSNKRYVFYQSPEELSLHPHVKTRILIDKEPNLYWVSFEHSLYQVHRMTKKWEKAPLQLKEKEHIESLKQDVKNPSLLWVYTNQRVLQWNKKEKKELAVDKKNLRNDKSEIKYFSKIKNIQSTLKIGNHLYAISSGSLDAAYKNAGLYVYDLKKEEEKKLEFIAPLPFFGIHKTHRGELWLAAGRVPLKTGEILKANPKTQKIIFQLTPREWKLPLLKSKNLKVQEYTINSYFYEKDHSFVFKTISPFLSSREERVQLAAFQTLTREWPENLFILVLKQIEKILKTEKNEKILISSLDILAFNPSQKTREISQGFLKHQNELVALKAQWAVNYITKKMGGINDKKP